jgi:C-terminal processing protease CtpA/Prc
LTFSSYVSPDGKRIAGTGIDPQLKAYSWIVTLR